MISSTYKSLTVTLLSLAVISHWKIVTISEFPLTTFWVVEFLFVILNLPALIIKSAIWTVPAIEFLDNGSSELSYVPSAVNEFQFRFLNVIVLQVVAEESILARTLTSLVFET